MNSVRENVLEIIKNPNSMLSHDSCNGYPYLQLDSLDYNLEYADTTYSDLAELIKKFGYNHKWFNSKCSFFDIHPVFSNAKPIPSLMGFHLSLILFDKGIAGSSQSLYFDTATNWRKFTRITEKRVYPVSSWIQFDEKDIVNLEDDSDFTENQIFLATSINLLKGSELSNIHITPPTTFNSNLLKFYNVILNKNFKDREILASEVLNFKSFIETELYKNPKFEKSALYLFTVIFCREFGLSYEDFDSLVKELDLNFDFNGNADIILYTNKCLNYIHELKIKIGDYFSELLTYEQSDINFDNKKDLSLSNSDVDSSNEIAISNLKETPKSYSIENNYKYYEMQPSLTNEFDCRKIIYSIWKDLVLCFYGQDLNQEVYNKLRNIMDTYVTNEIVKRKLLSFENFDTQFKEIQMASFDIFMRSTFDLNIIAEDNSKIGKDLFSSLTPPQLTEEQISSKNLLNTTAQEKMIQKIMDQYCQNLVVLLNLSIGKLAHPNFNSEHGLRLSKIDHDTLKSLVIEWYRKNYIQEYLKLSNSYEDIFNYIQNDANSFSNNSLIEKALLNEVKYFLRIRHNPFLILDFDTNY